jgi:Flp pilus assembly protein TadD
MIVLATFGIYCPVIHNEFINLDDTEYVTANSHVQGGLTPQNLIWAFTSTTVANWHPLTMLSLLVDGQLSPKDRQTEQRTPSLFHLTNLILHCASTLLLFWVLAHITDRLWASAWVAAMFGLHPLHVESVAWVAERKDVLSALFWMLSLLAYIRYVEAQTWKRWSLVFLMMALGLLAKPMLVSLPFILLLLDYWPLERLLAASPPERAQPFRKLLREKLPLLALAGLFCIITLIAQWRGWAIRSFGDVPFWLRLERIPVAYVIYLRKMIWPTDLIPYYLFLENGPSAWEVGSATVILVAITFLAWSQRFRHRYLLVGWLWYVLSLVPVIGIIQVGDQAYADRYTYLPLIGIFIALAWGIPDALFALGQMPLRQRFATSPQNKSARLANPAMARYRAILAAIGVTTVINSAIFTRVQIGYWSDDEHLWEHALEVAPDNYYAQNYLGHVLVKKGRLDEAVDHFSAAVSLNPKFLLAQENFANVLYLQGKQSEAISRLSLALDKNPDSDVLHATLAGILLRTGQADNAVRHFREALRIRPDNAEAYTLLGIALLAQGHANETAEILTEGIRLAPDSPEGRHQLGLALIRLKRWQQAAASLESAVALEPKNPTYRCDLGLALNELGKPSEAGEQYQEASRILPNWPDRFNKLAIRFGLCDKARSLELAMEVCQGTGDRDPSYMETLAAAYAATGDFRRACKTSGKAIEVALASNKHDLARRLKAQLTSYRASLSSESKQTGN